MLIAITNLDVVVDVTDNNLPGNLIIVAVDETIVAVIVLAIFLINDDVDVAVADNVLNRVNNLLIVAVDVDEDNIDLR